MGQSLVRMYIHLVFSTKYRLPLIDNEIEQSLHSYLGGICKTLECTPVQIGGYVDHVHVLCVLSKKLTLIKLLEVLKSHSSKWIKTKGEKYKNFYWQDGYGAFSISEEDVANVVRYISHQHEHHHKKSFQEEYRELLRELGIEWDERYVWD